MWARNCTGSRINSASRWTSGRAQTQRRLLMQLDDLKLAWAMHGANLERSLAINERLLRETLLGRMRRALAPFVAVRALETAIGLVSIVAAVSVLANHFGDP